MEKTMTNGRAFIIALCTAVAVSAAGMILSMAFWSAEVPVLRFMDIKAARAVATSHGFPVWVVAEEESLSVPAGNVLDQSPNDGERVFKGTTLLVRISAGKTAPKAPPATANAAVPPIVGAPLATARVTLEQAGLKVGEVKKEMSDQGVDIVLRATPEAGVPLPRGATVNLLVSSGKKMAKVPKVTMKNLDRARALLKAAGFEVGQTRSASNEDFAFGRVLSQKPAAGDQAPMGSAVDLVINREEQ
jgi:serine/threonine-protein kinase